MIRVFAVAVMLCLVVAGQSVAAESDSAKELARLQKENKRLASVIKEKDRALDLAISSIKRGFKRIPVVQHNPYMLDATIDTGWEPVDLEGVGKVSLKAYKDLALIRAAESDRPFLLALLGHRTVSVFSCGVKQTCVALSDKDLIR